MTARARAGGRAILAIVALVALALLVHFAILGRFPRAVGAAVALVPLGAFVLVALRRTARPAVGMAAVALCAVAAWIWWSRLENHFLDLFLVEHVSLNLGLAIVFGRTLLPGHEPLCTAFARLVHESLIEEVERYTRKVTVAWTVFFVAVAALSIALYALDLRFAWSLLVNVGSPVLLAFMFLAEYAVRLRVLPHWERVGIFAGIRAYSRHFRTAPAEQPSR